VDDFRLFGSYGKRSRIRHYYLDLAGDDARYFVLGGNDDMQGGLANISPSTFGSAMAASSVRWSASRRSFRPRRMRRFAPRGSRSTSVSEPPKRHYVRRGPVEHRCVVSRRRITSFCSTSRSAGSN